MPIHRATSTQPEATSAGIRKGDQVTVMSGRDRGKTGRVLAVDPRKRTVTVEHANIIKRHTRANPQKNVKGGILEKEGPIQISNVLLHCPACNKHTRIGRKIGPDGAKSRVCRRCGAVIER
jgi:large subunit ribosomal protein L24